MKITVGLDIGASSVKVSYFAKNSKEIKDFMFLNRVDVSSQCNDGDLITIGNEALKIGCIGGQTNQVLKKINYDYIEYILAKVAYEVAKDYGEYSVCMVIKTCLPPSQFKEFKVPYIQRLSLPVQTCHINGKQVTYSIEQVKCGVEGAILLPSLPASERINKYSKLMLLDVGSSTTDIILLAKRNDVWSIKQATTSTVAGTSFCKEIAMKLNQVTHANYNWQDLETTGDYQLRGQTYSIKESASLIDDSVKLLLSDVLREGSFVEYMPVLTGRGAEILANNDLFKEKTEFILLGGNVQTYGNSRGCLLI